MVGEMNAIALPVFRTAISNSSPQIHSYAELQERLHHDLRAQHPEWVDANGNSPRCDWYDERFAKLVSIFQSVEAQS
jgi:hypothetical protein